MIESQYSFRSPFPLSTCRIGIKILQPMLASSTIEFNLLACLQFVFCTNSCISLLNLNFLFVGILKIQNRCSITFITFVFQHITLICSFIFRTWPICIWHCFGKQYNSWHLCSVISSIENIGIINYNFYTFSLWFNVIQQSSIEYQWTNCSLLKDSFHFIST